MTAEQTDVVMDLMERGPSPTCYDEVIVTVFKTSRVAKRDDLHSKLLFFVKNKGQWNVKCGPKVADGNVAMRPTLSGRLEPK